MTNTSGLPVTLNESTRPFHVPSNALLASATAGISSSAEIRILMRLPLVGLRAVALCDALRAEYYKPASQIHQQSSPRLSWCAPSALPPGCRGARRCAPDEDSARRRSTRG